MFLSSNCVNCPKMVWDSQNKSYFELLSSKGIHFEPDLVIGQFQIVFETEYDALFDISDNDAQKLLRLAIEASNNEELQKYVQNEFGSRFVVEFGQEKQIEAEGAGFLMIRDGIIEIFGK